MTWYFHNTPIEFTENDVKDHFGFVYLITHNQSGRKYIGKKFFTKSKTKQVKGKKKRTRVKSDWEDYYGSNKELLDEIKVNGKDNYTREVLHLCRSRSTCSYYETYEIFCRHALLTDTYYNAWVSCRIRKDHLKNT
jgi:Putative endonuclease segE, GIY-YIG domain